MFKLVDGWADKWWRLWSMRLAMVVSATIGWISVNPGDWQQAMGFLPDWARPALGGLTFAIIFYSRLHASEEKGAPPAPSSDG